MLYFIRYRVLTITIKYIFIIEFQNKIDCVIHFAAMKAVGESMEYPLLYYKNNIIGMLNLLEVMERYNCYQLVFSSSCTVYGEPTEFPVTESHSIGQNITNVYGKTKYFIEEMLEDISHSNEVCYSFSTTIYFLNWHQLYCRNGI